ncbi:MAG: hypothetical protein NT094_04295, partial [Candidatus Staskawiczbacteria bacterium]|nr:hypothetical protein [Candidatus Staskawiczbacteria bacterium]
QINVNNILTEVNLNDTPRGNKVVADCVQLIDLSKTAICFIDDSKYVAKDVSYKEFQDFVNQKLEQN